MSMLSRVFRVIEKRQQKPASAGEALFDALESRQLLTSDLGIAFNVDRLSIPDIAVPGDFIVPDTEFETGILVINHGPDAAVGLVNIAFYLSLDTTLNTSTDLLMRLYDREPLSLPVDNGNPANWGEFDPDMRVPSETAPGNYFIIARITYPNTEPDLRIIDTNSSNNIAVSADTVHVERKFGNVGERSDITMVLKDAEDTLVAFTLTGAGTGSVTVDGQGRYVITTTGTGTASDISITTNGGDGSIDFVTITIAGAIRSFSAPNARLVGTFNPGTSLSSLTLGNVIGASPLVIPATSASPTITLGDVSDFSITSDIGIASLTAKSWNDNDTTTDTISATYLDVLRTLGTGNFEASLRLSGGAASGQSNTLRSVSIGGVIKGGTWVINGSAGTISAMASVADWSATFFRRLTSISTTTGTLRGVVTAASFGTVSAGKDILAAKILAGAFLGQDGVIGGSGSNADSYIVGRFDRVLVTRNVANSIIAAGLKSISGTGVDQPLELVGGVNAKFGELRIGNVAGVTARFLANRYNGPTTIGGQAVDVRTNSRFQIVTLPPTVSATSTSIDADGVTITVRFDSFGLMDLASLLAGVVRVEGPNSFSQLPSLVSKSFVAGSLQKSAQAVFRVASPAGGWTSGDDGEYSVKIVSSTAKDTRGNFVASGEFSQFLIDF